MYKVVNSFTDLQDNNFVYREGDIFPHDGKEVSEERINELAGAYNKLGKPLIEKVEDPGEEPEEIPEEVSEEKPKAKRNRKKNAD